MFGIPAEPALVPSAALFLTGSSAIMIGSYLTISGQFVQGSAGGSWGPFRQSVGAIGLGALIPEPYSVAVDFGAGVIDALDPSANQQTCPAGGG